MYYVKLARQSLIMTIAFVSVCWSLESGPSDIKKFIYNPGHLKAVDSQVKVKVGDKAPDFSLPAISGEKISLSGFLGEKECGFIFRAGCMDAGVFPAVAGL